MLVQSWIIFLHNHTWLGRHKLIGSRIPHHFSATRPPMQCFPDFQQNALGIFSPLAIPES